LAKFLNMHGGICILDCLSKTAVMDLLEVEYAQIRSIEATSAEPTVEAAPA
jgi:hypothetical protein